ncbi:ABC transporter ATP-binding protein [Paracoccus denitrificans]|jgi:branched-chain amino acid transport system ATP-binding protein|uniref:Amino acid/amide ABC transporter ATP-binding protein 2, HAAT family n=1 Tax=Paracoccus denitrificans (strain Pd 1222) TaxID=318586 RepID=A1AYF1_PARDP|nr:ABC transporter ATP-binding protein [Paracoccus denitrificans]ABL68295.1 amino acid/amide ABC transporter ATP-binding protein 2, HAAT family [Paracoccus denitrificans PD1222]MBB4627809.1 branched-chain amino acid transport system ATP-binding protein [Paracoccus denitrificans]MCU7428655.1 ABC transporter ATP-binding protein [Paracoccus denitrificans]QAR26385.1 ABC transporter ATP-binding protein [Paracoccus denitrificans]UPV95313.1 ABC transporter ATP-binding protein [Paracoccus denitrifican
MLKVQNLTSGYDRSQILFDISFEVGAGEVVCLMGRNGMGKTTTVRALMGLLPAWDGAVEFEGRQLNGMSAARVAKRGLGLVPEGRQIFPNLTVHENLRVAAANRRGQPDPWTVERIYELFPGLHERIGSHGNLLSGGEQQMLAIGRALMTNPSLLILDEATEGLAPVIRDQIWDCIARLRGLGQSIVVIDKHVKRLLDVADRFYVVEKGRTVWSGDPDRVRAEDDRIKGYLTV